MYLLCSHYNFGRLNAYNRNRHFLFGSLRYCIIVVMSGDTFLICLRFFLLTSSTYRWTQLWVSSLRLVVCHKITKIVVGIYIVSVNSGYQDGGSPKPLYLDLQNIGQIGENGQLLVGQPFPKETPESTLNMISETFSPKIANWGNKLKMEKISEFILK